MAVVKCPELSLDVEILRRPPRKPKRIELRDATDVRFFRQRSNLNVQPLSIKMFTSRSARRHKILFAACQVHAGNAYIETDLRRG